MEPQSGVFDRSAVAPLVLLVDDCEDATEMYAFYLRREGMRVAIANDATRALDAARTVTPDAIVMDANLPDLDGIETTRLLKHDPRTRGIPVLVLTVMPERKQEARAAGAAGFLPKPCVPARLARELRRLLGLDVDAALGG